MSEPKRPSTLIQAVTICGHDMPLSDDAAKDVVDRVKEGGLLDMHDAWFIEEHAYAKTHYDKLLLETSRQLNMAFSMVLPNGATIQPTTNAPPWMNMFCSLAQRLSEGYRTSDIIKQLKDLEQLGAPTTALENSLINAHKNLVNLFIESAKLPKTTAEEWADKTILAISKAIVERRAEIENSTTIQRLSRISDPDLPPQ